MTPPFMYYSVAWAWLEYLTRGQDEAEDTMTECLRLAQATTTPTDVAATGDVQDTTNEGRLGGAVAGEYEFTVRKCMSVETRRCWVF